MTSPHEPEHSRPDHALTVSLVPIADIILTDRRRQEIGDVSTLAESIAQMGLLHPIVIDDGNILVVGQRRIEAYKYLGLTEIPARRYRDLSDEERLNLELTENIQRRDLSAFERSQAVIRAAEIAARLAAMRPPPLEPLDPGPIPMLDGLQDSVKDPPDEFRLEPNHNPPGRPSEPGSDRDVATMTGIPQPTISLARTHLRAVEAYPELAGEPQEIALDYATAVKREPELRESHYSIRGIANRERLRKHQESEQRRLEHANRPEELRRRFNRAREEITVNLLAFDPVRLASSFDDLDGDLARDFVRRVKTWLTKLDREITQREIA